MKGLEVHFSSLIFTGFKVSSKHVHIPQLQMSNSTDSTSDDTLCSNCTYTNMHYEHSADSQSCTK